MIIRMKNLDFSIFRPKCVRVLRELKIRVDRLCKALIKGVPSKRDSSNDWLGSMKDRIEILGDVIQPATEETDWEVLRN